MTDELLDEAVAAGVPESADLDWKLKLHSQKGLAQTDFPKDVAAMANSGGGLIIYGVRESQKKAIERVDVEDFDENYERSLRSAAITAITPPVFGLNVIRLDSSDKCAVVVEVPASVDGPHLIYRGDYFGAPVRNDADTVWMKERQIEAMYRARFDERRHATEALDVLYEEAAAGRDSGNRAWLIGVAHPRLPRVGSRLTRDAARGIFRKAHGLAEFYAGSVFHPLQSVDQLNPRPGLRRWVAVNSATNADSKFKEAWASIHHDGSVTIACIVGGYPTFSGVCLEGWQVRSTAIECVVADLMALVRETAAATGGGEYDIRVGVEFTGEEPLKFVHVDVENKAQFDGDVPLHQFSPVELTVNASESDVDFHQSIRNLAQDCINQGGLSDLQLIQMPEDQD